MTKITVLLSLGLSPFPRPSLKISTHTDRGTATRTPFCSLLSCHASSPMDSTQHAEFVDIQEKAKMR